MTSNNFLSNDKLYLHAVIWFQMVDNGLFASEMVGWLVGFYGISIFVGYLTPNPFSYK